MEVSSLPLDHLLKSREWAAGLQFVGELSDSVLDVECLARCHQKLTRQAQSDVSQRTIDLPREYLDRLIDLAGVAGHAPQRLMHVGQQVEWPVVKLADWPMLTRLSAKCIASPVSRINAPLPCFTSSTSASSPSASFLLMMLAVISGIDGRCR